MLFNSILKPPINNINTPILYHIPKFIQQCLIAILAKNDLILSGYMINEKYS